MRALLPRAALPTLLALAAGCSTDIPGLPNALTPGEVEGTYQLCELRFTPVQRALPEADVLARVMDATPPPVAILSGAAPEFELVYARRGSSGVQQLRGDVEFGPSSVFLHLHSQTASGAPLEMLLPPSHLDLIFHPAERRLTAGEEVSAYTVRRQDYARAAGISPEGLQERIRGHVTAALAQGACG